MTTRIDLANEWEQSFSKNALVPFSIHCTFKDHNWGSSLPTYTCPDVHFDWVLGPGKEKIGSKQLQRLILGVHLTMLLSNKHCGICAIASHTLVCCLYTSITMWVSVHIRKVLVKRPTLYNDYKLTLKRENTQYTSLARMWLCIWCVYIYHYQSSYINSETSMKMLHALSWSKA